MRRRPAAANAMRRPAAPAIVDVNLAVQRPDPSDAAAPSSPHLAEEPTGPFEAGSSDSQKIDTTIEGKFRALN